MSKNKKRILIIILVICAIAAIILILPYINKMTQKEKMIEYVENIDYDIKAYYKEKSIPVTGYASRNTYYLIDTEQKIKYKIDDYYVFGNEKDPTKKGHNYTVTKSEISDEELNKLIKYAEEPQKNEYSNNESNYYLDGEWIVEYKSKEVDGK